VSEVRSSATAQSKIQNPMEGQVKFEVGGAFYNPESQIVRDLGVLAAGVYRGERGQLRVLDAMAGCGVRSLRYWQESQADWVWANEGNPENGPILQLNLAEAIAAGQGRVTHQNSDRVFCACYNDRDYYDLIDLDSFGSPTPYLSTALRATKMGGLLYLTSTDGRTATGHLPEQSLSIYGAYARSHPAAHEQGLRLVLGAVSQQAAILGLGIQPIFSLFSGQTYRVMARLLAKSVLSSQNYGFLGYCHHCGEYQVVSWRKLGRGTCLQDNLPLTLSGPMWLGNLHDRAFLPKMQSLAQQWNWGQQQQLLALMEQEADFPPYFYTLGEIGRRGKMDVPTRSRLIQALQERGYRATPTHINAQALKTNADLATCIAIANS
jgi:tRNA (guanine26-N2/guanine27-N2)-dimethyltransferase